MGVRQARLKPRAHRIGEAIQFVRQFGWRLSSREEVLHTVLRVRMEGRLGKGRT